MSGAAGFGAISGRFQPCFRLIFPFPHGLRWLDYRAEGVDAVPDAVPDDGCLARIGARAGGLQSVLAVGSGPLVDLGGRLILAGCARISASATRLDAVWQVFKCCHAGNMHHWT